MEEIKIQNSFVAKAELPEPLSLHLLHEPITQSSHGALNWLGWSLVVRKLSPDGEELMFRDHWEMTLLEILRYPDDYSDVPLLWRREGSRQQVDLVGLQPKFDASKRLETAVKVVVSPDANQRLCFNLYSNERYRYTLEERLCDGKLTAWVPKDWSPEQVDLSGAEELARRNCSWLRK